MEIVYFLLPAALLLGGIGALAFVWAVRSRQFEDLETPARRLLVEDEQGPDSQN